MASIYTSFEAALANPTDVKILHLVKQKGVKKLLKQVTSFVNLEELKIDSCTMSAIPKEVFELTELKSLTIANCGHRLKAYPEELGNLVSLEELYLNKQWMETLPETQLDQPIGPTRKSIHYRC